MAHQRIMNVDAVTWDEIGDGKSIAARRGLISKALGSTGLGCSIIAIPPGKRAFPFHRHHVIHEMFFILSGEGVTRIGEESFPIRAGDLIAAPAGAEPHQIINTGAVDLEYLAFSTTGEVDIVEYPDSGKMAAAAGIKNADFATATYKVLGRITPMAYYEDEGP
jgi:uncharacterized cupin superfamily protein